MTEIGKFHKTVKIFEIQDGGGRHLGLLITSAWIERFAWNLNYVYPDVTETSICTAYTKTCHDLENIIKNAKL